jgi:cell division protein FtsB
VVTKKRHHGIVSLPRIVTIVTFTLVAFLVIDFGRKALDSFQVERQVEWLREQVALEQERNEALHHRLEYVASDAYVEKIARERLQLIKPGERMVVVVPTNAEPSSVTHQTRVVEEQQNEDQAYWQQWANLLVGSGY